MKKVSTAVAKQSRNISRQKANHRTGSGRSQQLVLGKRFARLPLACTTFKSIGETADSRVLGALSIRQRSEARFSGLRGILSMQFQYYVCFRRQSNHLMVRRRAN